MNIFEKLKRSARLMKEKWGESPGSTFSFGLLRFIAFLVICIPLFFVGMIINPILGIILGARIIFCNGSIQLYVGNFYHRGLPRMNGDPVKNFNEHLLKIYPGQNNFLSGY